MSIHYDENLKKFHICTPNQSYIFAIDERDALRNLYWGNKINNCEDILLPPYPERLGYCEKVSFKEEFNCRGSVNYLEPCLLAHFSDGVSDVRLRYKSHKILKTDNGEKLSVIMQDEYYPLKVELNYITYDNLDIISKNAVIINEGNDLIKLDKFKSGCLYPEYNHKSRLMYFSGQWCSEYEKNFIELHQGMFTISNNRGTSSGPHFVPFVTVDSGDATETHGNVWYATLHWSGNFRIDCEKSCIGQVTISAGINDFDCNIELKSGKKFETPLLTFGFSNGGFEKMTETLYDYQFEFLGNQQKINKIFPIIYNSWYPYWMNVNEENCLSMIDKAREIGVELIVIDDGWFKNRNDITAGLGDWVCHCEKFPNGLKPIADKAHACGMKFGLWIEPEMININSDLYKQHPEWVLEYKTRERTQFRYQSILNLARDDVREFVWETVDRVISEFELDYVKWDMNAYMTEIGNDTHDGNTKEITVKYIQNLYEVWRRMNEKYPDVLFENCAHGGARADYGMSPYADRINRSDNADPIDVLRIHEGFTTYLLPKLAGGAGNIANSPLHLTHRRVPLEYRAHLGMTGAMSVGIDLLTASQDELNKLTEYLAQYKKIRNITQRAYLYRLSSAFEHDMTAWEYLARNRKNAVVFIFAHNIQKIYYPPCIKVRGLNPDKKYRVSGLIGDFDYDKSVYTKSDDIVINGDSLMNYGLKIEPRGDYFSQLITIDEI